MFNYLIKMNNFTKTDTRYTLPTLYKITKNNKEIRWDIFVVYDKNPHVEIMTDSYYYPDGKHKISDPTIVVGKNKGRANETTNLQQALSRALSLWTRKKDTYMQVGINELKTLRPMLANKYLNCKDKYLSEPFAVSPKLDGIRAIGSREGLETRNGKSIYFLETIKSRIRVLLKQYDCILDGELYSHDLSFNELSGIVRSTKEQHHNNDEVQYWIFDIVDDTKTYKERVEIIMEMKNTYETIFPGETYLVFLDYVLSKHDDVRRLHDEYISKGYEGLIARQLNSFYEIGARSNYLLKYKEFQDDEFEITGFTTGVGGEEGAIIFICKTDSGNFSVRPRGSMEYRRALYDVGDTLIGKRLTVRYQELDSITGVPRFPVGIIVRDYE
jgi:ATP-dependent DNA ligase